MTTETPILENDQPLSLSKAVEGTVVFIAHLAKKYSMKQETVLGILQLELQLFHMAEQQKMMGTMSNGQALVDAIGEEQAAKRREADEVITAEEVSNDNF